MKFSRRDLGVIPCGIAACALVWGVLGALPSAAQQAVQKKTTKAAPKAQPKRPPLTQATLQKLWDGGDQDLLLNELRLGGLAFEPDEDWVNHLPNLANMPLATAELRKLVPPAPSVEAVTTEAPGILAKLKDAAQKRSETDMEPLVHPDLLANKARVYDLFDIANYRNHSLGRIVPMDNRRVGVQFFQLTTSQVERLHYLTFATSHGKIVLRDVITGPGVAALFLHDEQQLATSKLDLMFRALNDRDDSGLKNLCTPGMYDSLKKLSDAGGSTLVRGKYTSISTIALTPSVSLDEKSARVVVKVGYPDAGAKPLEYNVEFERINNDLKVVRVRDMQGGIVAWDPNIDNYLNRRYNLPDGPPVTEVAKSDDIRFYPITMVQDFVIRALETRNAPKLKELAAEFLARQSSGGEGYGVRAAAEQILGAYDDAAKDAALAIDRGGTAYFIVLRHNSAFGSADTLASGQQFFPAVLGVSKTKIDFRPFSDQGRPAEQIAIASIQVDQIEKRYGAGKPRPFLNLEFSDGAKKTYNFAAFGTSCPGEKPTPGVDPYQGGSTCPAPAAAAPAAKKSRFGLPGGLPVSIPGGGIGGLIPGGKNGATVPMLVPQKWQQDLKVVADAIEEARRGGTPGSGQK